MNSLKIKLFGLIAVIVVVIISIASVVNFTLQRRMITTIAVRNGLALAETVKSSIADAMRTGNSQEVTAVFSRIQAQESVKAVRIVDETGKILVSGEPAEIGRRLVRPELQVSSQGPFYVPGDGSVNNILSPIMNGPGCYACHEPGKKVLGILDVDLSLKYIASDVALGKRSTIVATIGTIALLLVLIFLFLNHYVDKPIKAIILSMRQIEMGDFSSSVTVTSSKEMRLLSFSFNRMVQKLKALLDSAITAERKLATAQLKLAHHHEIHEMNQQLEEQLQEIESLNQSLQNRLGDIETAHALIAEMATELELKNQNLEEAVARLATLYKVGLSISETMEPDHLFRHIVQMTMQTLNAQIGYILLYDPDNEGFHITTHLGHDRTEAPGTIIPFHSASVSSWVVENRKPLLVTDTSKNTQFNRFSTLGYERKTLVCAPLLVKDEIIGTITMANRDDDGPFSGEDLELLTTIAAQAAIAIKNAMLYEEQQHIYLTTVQILVSAMEAVDSYNRGHSERVTLYSLELAKKLGLSPERVKLLEQAAILHDIGKISLAPELLHKKGKLTPHDLENLKEHPVIGMKILEPLPFLRDVRDCIGQHHERYDGMGYPNRIRDDELLFEARILAIADAYDAMTSDRSYRPALSREHAITELLDNAGSQFDPELVPHFIDLLNVEGEAWSQEGPCSLHAHGRHEEAGTSAVLCRMTTGYTWFTKQTNCPS